MAMLRQGQALTGAASLRPVLCALLPLLLLLPKGRGEAVKAAAFLNRNAMLCAKNYVGDEAPWELCGVLRPEAMQPLSPATLMSIATMSFNISAGINKNFTLWVSVSGGVKFNVNATLEAARWTRLCVGIRPSPYNTSDAASNTTSLPGPKPAYQVWMTVGIHFLEVSESEDYRLSQIYWKSCFGHKSTTDSRSFVGFVTAVSGRSNFTEWPLVNASCSEAVSRDEENISFWIKSGAVLLFDVEEEQVCSEQVHEITLYASHGHRGFRKMCNSLGGALFTVEEVVTDEEDNSSCVTEEGFVSWLRGAGLEEERVWDHCPALLINGTAGQRLCVQDLPCSRCRVPFTTRYSLYGPVEDFDRQYSLRMFPNGSFYFEGKHTSTISRRGDGWALWSRLHHRWWRVGHGAWPMGRSLWYSPYLNATLTFSSCNVIEFPADDGTCLLRSQRCDGYQDHPDGSDELNCRDRLISKTHDYDTAKSPFEKFRNEKVFSYFQIRNIDQISAAQGVATIQLFAYIFWNDHRLRLVDSKMGKQMFPCENIWRPKLYMYSGDKYGPLANVSHLIEHCFVAATLQHMEVNVTDPLVGWVTSKDIDVMVFMNIEMQVSSACRPRLSRYPFGRYTCNTSMEISPHEDMKWSGERKTLHFPNNPDLLDYHLDKVSLTPRDHRVIITLHLTGQYEYHLLASFSPSGLMFIICYSTQHYPIGNFNERLMASLTSLLVLVALFSQATATNVKTPYFKLLDVWYVVLIVLCFLVVVANALVQALNHYGGDIRTTALDEDDQDDKDTGGKRCVTRRAVWCNVFCRTLLFSVFVLLILACVLIAKEYI